VGKERCLRWCVVRQRRFHIDICGLLFRLTVSECPIYPRSRSEEPLLKPLPCRFSDTRFVYGTDDDLLLSAFVQTAVRHQIPAAY